MVMKVYTEQVVHSAVLTTHQPVPSQSPGSGSSPSQLPSVLQLFCMHIIWNTSLASVGPLSWFCYLPASCVPAAPSLAEQHEKLGN